MQKSQTKGFSQLAALRFSLDLKCIYINPTPILKAIANLMFVKDFIMLWGFGPSLASDWGNAWSKLCLWEIPRGLNMGEELRCVDTYSTFTPYGDQCIC